ncbi:hypothetical protein B0T14DRAFT_86739 [Immersiella caudata]|uniref:Extracellular membrane protein CFEM domain-containing protein n=1 Tax=Immersiella caudata TaxID=314043 RepID=A0AA39XJC1_9PEZI|nr:hypothetical protein B0T14DRAFT_86739 [Immersiella caudata]
MTTTSLATLSIKLSPEYSALRICAQTCVDRGNDNSDLEGHLECGDQKILNACYCREDLRPKATTFLSSCIVTRCKYNNQDVTSALRLYDGYCSSATKTTVATTRSTVRTSTTRSSTVSPTTLPFETPAPSTQTSTTGAPTSTVGNTTSSPQTGFSSPPGSTVTTTTTTPIPNTGITTSEPPIAPAAIAGIVIGAIATVILGIAVLMWICRRKQKERHIATSGGQFGEHNVYPSAAAFDSKSATSPGRSVESFDMGTIAMKADAPGSHYGDMYPLVQGPVEICDTGPGFRAELSAGGDVAYRKEMG